MTPSERRNTVFLDIDGVLVNKKSWYVRSGRQATADPPCVEVLNKITDAADAVIVVSSSWRIGQTLEQIRKILKGWGVKAKCVGLTPVLNAKASMSIYLATTRGMEILAYLEKHRGTIKDFVILDDESDMHPYLHKLVKTEFDFGLTEAHIALATERLSIGAELEAAKP